MGRALLSGSCLSLHSLPLQPHPPLTCQQRVLRPDPPQLILLNLTAQETPPLEYCLRPAGCTAQAAQPTEQRQGGSSSPPPRHPAARSTGRAPQTFSATVQAPGAWILHLPGLPGRFLLWGKKSLLHTALHLSGGREPTDLGQWARRETGREEGCSGAQGWAGLSGSSYLPRRLRT